MHNFDISIDNITPDTAEDLCRKITADLPEYFGLPQVNEHYAVGVRSRINLAAKIGSQYVGLISLELPYPANANIYWMAVLKDFHGKGIGTALITATVKHPKLHKARSITVETLAPFEADENYLKTYKFYEAQGFLPLFNLKPRDYEWNMVYMHKILSASLIK